ncbi:MAG: serine/threonine-protein kinase, partial [Gemmatimonadota bacterium]
MEEQERLSSALADAYQIGSELDRGGMATVYLAQDLKHDRPVAIKVLRPELAAGLGTERFIREIEISANLAHPHILPLFDSGDADGLLYYVMPYVEGESLQDRLEREGKLPAEEAIRLTDQIASALSYAHERGVVHRDIKPANILLAGDQAIVADFGIARALEAASTEGLTFTGLAVGTPAYMSPEQAMDGEEVDARSDVYSLGCVVYEMMTGDKPFEETDPAARAAKGKVGRGSSLRTTDPSIPVFLDRAVSKALATDPGERFDTAAAFAEALT